MRRKIETFYGSRLPALYVRVTYSQSRTTALPHARRHSTEAYLYSIVINIRSSGWHTVRFPRLHQGIGTSISTSSDDAAYSRYYHRVLVLTKIKRVPSTPPSESDSACKFDKRGGTHWHRVFACLPLHILVPNFSACLSQLLVPLLRTTRRRLRRPLLCTSTFKTWLAMSSPSTLNHVYQWPS